MELLLFIYALQGGVMGDVTEPQATYFYIEADVGVELNDAFLLATYHTEIDPETREFSVKQLTLSMYFDHEGVSAGINYTFDLNTDAETAEIFFRVQSW